MKNKDFRDALLSDDIDSIVDEVLAQEDDGAQVLDVNAELSEIDEPLMLTNVVKALQVMTALPLQIDTSDPEAMERALRIYNGKAMIRSVSGRRESIEAVFPLVKKYGGLCVALTLDENGIPETAEGRVEIAKQMILEAEKYGIAKKDIIFDTLATAIGVDVQAALRASDIIKNELGCLTLSADC